MTSISTSISGSDAESLVEKIKHSFSRLGYQQLRAVKCSDSAGAVVLSGELNSFYLKQVAQSVAIKVPGVISVSNEIVVAD